jgi:cobalamin biosynthesis protein CobW
LAAAAEDDLATRPSHHDAVDGEHDHDEFDSFILTLGPIADPETLEARLIATIEEHDILRIKGFIDVPGKRRRHVVQAVGARVARYFDRDWGADEARESRLVVIGLAPLDRAAISAALLA